LRGCNLHSWAALVKLNEPVTSVVASISRTLLWAMACYASI